MTCDYKCVYGKFGRYDWTYRVGFINTIQCQNVSTCEEYWGSLDKLPPKNRSSLSIKCADNDGLLRLTTDNFFSVFSGDKLSFKRSCVSSEWHDTLIPFGGSKYRFPDRWWKISSTVGATVFPLLIILLSIDIFLSLMIFFVNNGSSSGSLGSMTTGFVVGTSTMVGFKGLKSNPTIPQLSANPKIEAN